MVDFYFVDLCSYVKEGVGLFEEICMPCYLKLWVSDFFFALKFFILIVFEIFEWLFYEFRIPLFSGPPFMFLLTVIYIVRLGFDLNIIWFLFWLNLWTLQIFRWVAQMVMNCYTLFAIDFLIQMLFRKKC